MYIKVVLFGNSSFMASNTLLVDQREEKLGWDQMGWQGESPAQTCH
jgi:hypothetical protein